MTTKPKSKSKSKFITLFYRIFNFREWLDWDRVKTGIQFIKTGAKQVFISNVKRPDESFDAVQKRLQLTDEDLTKKSRALFRLSMLMCALSLVLFGYAIYHFIYGTIHAGMFLIVLTTLSTSFAFRYHFWYFQIHSRKLGCTFSEWLHQGLMGNKS